MNKTVITCAITGAQTKPEQTPYLPITPEQIANSALEAAKAGASVVHIHVRDPESGRPSMKLELYKEVYDRIKDGNPELIINLTTGAGATGPSSVIQGKPHPAFKPPEVRVEHILALKPDICSLDLNTMNRGPENITVNTIGAARVMARLVKEAGVKPELEIFDSGDMSIAKMLIAEGLIEDPPLWQIAAGVKWGWEATSETLEYAKHLLPAGATWYAFGVSRMQMPFVALSTISGGHARVGLEDNLYISKGVFAKTNAELVTKAVRIIEDLGGSAATPAEARAILGLR
jgi:uncharacterized protein (DUF849 family)